VIKGWQSIEWFDDEGSAQALAGRLRIDGVPVAVKSDGPVPGVGAFHVLVPEDLAHRARSLLAQAAVTDAELDWLATGEPGSGDESEDR